MKSLKYIIVAPFVWIILTAVDLKNLFIEMSQKLWDIFDSEIFIRLFGGGSLLVITLMFFRALLMKNDLPFVSVIIAVPACVILLSIAVTMFSSKKNK